MKTQELLDIYYQGLDRKAGWESVLAEDFRFIGGHMTKPEPQLGKSNYVAVLQRLSSLYASVRVVKSFVDDAEAFVLAEYEWTFPHGITINGPVAELWKIKAERLQELRIFFDTKSFDQLVKG